MTEKNQNPEKREGSSYEGVKQLNALLNSDINGILADIKALRRKVDGLISSGQQKINVKIEQEAIRKEAFRPAPPPPPEKKTVKIAPPVVEQSAAEVKKSDDKKEEKAPVKPFEPTTQKIMPSYIRGVAVPTPAKPVRAPRPPMGTPYKKDGAPFERGSYGGGFGGGQGAAGSRPPYGTPRPFGQKPPFGTRPPLAGRPLAGARPATSPPIVNKDRKPDKKKEFSKPDEKKALNKRTLIRKGFITENLDDERLGSRKLKVKKIKEYIPVPIKKIEKAVITTENLTVKILSEKIGKTAQEIIKQLMVLDIMTTINSVVDFKTMQLVANELGVELELKLEQTKESMLEDIYEEVDLEKDLMKRPPIVTVMGHVDHGKTSLLDTIRNTSVATGEAGKITQHIGAYSTMCKGEKITFLDTPGHEAFTALRARGAKVTDIAILIVAADDGVMPQTVEAINHAKAANVPILVAINKIDKPSVDPEKIKQDLTAYNLVPEEWGGDTIMVPISAKRGDGIDKLLEMVLLLAEVNNYRANPERSAKGLIIEARVDKGKGPIANVVIQNGTLKVGDFVVSGISCGRVRAMVDDKGKAIKEAPPSTPISILGFTSVPSAGDGIYVVEDEKMAKQIIEERSVKVRNNLIDAGPKASLDELMDKINEGLLKELNLIVKADVQGSVEALKASLLKIVSDEVKVKVVHAGVGAINKSDIMLAEASRNAFVIGFNVRPDAESKALAEKAGIEIKLYDVIYDAIDDVEKAVKGMLTPKMRESISGRAQVRNVFKITNVGVIAGCYVLSGKINRGYKCRVYREGNLIHEGQIDGLKRFKDDVKEVATGFECGISVSNFSDIKENDEIECYMIEEIKA